MNPRVRFWLVFFGLTALLVWAYWLPLREMAERWSDDAQYSHGYLVPVFSLFLLWLRQREVPDLDLTPSWGGLVVFAAAAALWTAGTVF